MKINIQKATKINERIPHKKDFTKWLYYIFFNKKIELTIRIVTINEIILLNHTYRNKNIPTNVLSFPMNNIYLDKNHKKLYLGDIAICSSYLKKEAYQFKKMLKNIGLI
ncbi:conserved hypothetical protein, Predicted metal-dependent hydrolase [Buchnera aphidicola (Cinara tujafilina)]|uniref:Uncharacterized protein n=1 Tax=Buchnera aphidicola (Cinara tujafilina) TaxID=261317 RepID=F7WZJ5_9GAMM|nr:rRNA maturation RNase YbeY [Buchnera aphidicola]AEH39862.1 conserved hypothetical protein, Predicted metal-dependent hydrolase [Buchnera aphidicola (Cinara tujafilina)]